jgi:hypothetical protein
MKVLSLFFSLVFFVTANTFAQSDKNTVTGTVKEVKPKFLGAQSLIVDKTELVLMANQEDTTGNTFEINKEFNDLLKKGKNGNFVLNPKYNGKSLSFSYSVNGKGWNCVSHISHVKVAAVKKTKSSHVK